MAKIIIFGNTKNSELMQYFLTHDTNHDVVAFTVDEKYITDNRFCGKPVVPFETIETKYPPELFK